MQKLLQRAAAGGPIKLREVVSLIRFFLSVYEHGMGMMARRAVGLRTQSLRVPMLTDEGFMYSAGGIPESLRFIWLDVELDAAGHRDGAILQCIDPLGCPIALKIPFRTCAQLVEFLEDSKRACLIAGLDEPCSEFAADFRRRLRWDEDFEEVARFILRPAYPGVKWRSRMLDYAEVLGREAAEAAVDRCWHV